MNGLRQAAYRRIQTPGNSLAAARKKNPFSIIATRMRAAIREDNPILMGLSFGGMVCTEIAKQVPVQKTHPYFQYQILPNYRPG